MSKGWFMSLVLLPDVITGPGQYETRCGEVVTITQSSTCHDFGCRGTYSNGVKERWHKSGRIHFGQICDNDVIREVPAASVSATP